MPQTYATDSIGARIQAHYAQLACHECGSEPSLELRIFAIRHSDLVPAKDGAWIVTEYLCPACRRPVIKKAWLAFF